MKRSFRVHSLAWLAGLASALPAVGVASPSDNPTLASDWIWNLGAAFVSSDPVIGLGRDETGQIPLIDLSRTDGDGDTTAFFGRLAWQGLERWRFGFTTYDTDFDGGRFTDDDVSFGDLEIPAGSGIDVSTETRFYIFNAHYAIWQQPNWEAGAGIGVYGIDWEGSVGLRSGAGNIIAFESEDFLAPLPTLALYGKYAFNERLAMVASLDWLGLDLGDYDGEIFALTLGVDYWFNERWGLSGGVQLVDVDVTVEDQPFDKFLEADWESVIVSLNFAF